MLHLLWNMFNKTGQVNTYMFYKALEQEHMTDGNEIDQRDFLGGNRTATDQYTSLGDQS